MGGVVISWRSFETATIIVPVGHRCNNRCRFCSQADLPVQETPTDVLPRLERAYASGARRVEFAGGEPTLHDELSAWVAGARRLGFECVGVQTNGRRLAYQAYTAQLVAAGLTHVDISLHGATADAHEFHTTVPDSFRQTISGVRRSLAAPLSTAVTTAVTRSNVHEMTALATVLAALGIRHWRVILTQSVGRAATDPARLLPRWETTAQYLTAAQRIATTASCQMLVGGLPPCIEPALPRWVDRDLPSAFAAPCADCGFREACPGIDPGYLALYGDSELRPFTEATTLTGDEPVKEAWPFVGRVGRPACL